MLSLEDFVSATLGQIIGGVKAAQQDQNNNGASINHPAVNVQSSDAITAIGGGLVERIHFDVAVTATEREGSRGGAGVFVGPFGLGGQVEGAHESQSVSRISFSIPVKFPDPY